jgi:hypothetical protein
MGNEPCKFANDLEPYPSVHMYTGVGTGRKKNEVHAAQAKDLANFEDHLLSHLWEVGPRLRRSGGKNG